MLLIALAQRAGWLDRLNIGLMTAAGRARETGLGGHLTTVMRIASAVGGTAVRLVLLALVLGPLLWLGRRTAALWTIATIVGGTVLNLILKQIFAAPRPDLLPHLDMVNSYSFPSGHAAGNMMFFGAVAILTGGRMAYLCAGLVIALIGVSRVWLGVHWPSDVTAGWIEGLGWLALCSVWLPARGGQDQSGGDAAVRRHAVAHDEAVDPEAVDDGGERDRQQ